MRKNMKNKLSKHNINHLNAEKKTQKMKTATQELVGRKGWEILKATGVQKRAFHGFVRNFALVNSVALLVGSAAWALSRHHEGTDDDTIFHTAADIETADFSYDSVTYGIYGDMSYVQAIKNAYLWDDFRNGKGGLFQGICGLLSILIALICGVGGAKEAIDDKTYLEKVRNIYKQLEILKDYGTDAQKVMQNLEPMAKKLISKMSELDRGYFDNLLVGGLNKADYETCVGIIAGHLKASPEDYNKVVMVIDEATLPESIKKK